MKYYGLQNVIILVHMTHQVHIIVPMHRGQKLVQLKVHLEIMVQPDQLVLLELLVELGQPVQVVEPDLLVKWVLKVELVKLQGGSAPKGLLRCMLLNRLFPYAYVIGAHLLKREWGDMSKELADVDDVEDPRNGLLLYKPLEWAFDTSRLAFTWDEATSRFVAHLLDGHLANVKLVEKAKELLKDRYRRSEDADELGEMCFSDVDGLPLVLPVGFLPFRRCLCLHANLAREEALRNAWLSPGSFEFQDFWSSDGDDKVLAWLHLQQVTLQEVAEEPSNSTSSSGE